MTSRAAFEYHEAQPPREVDSVIHSLWGFWTTADAPDTYEHTIWPDGCVSLGVAVSPQHSGMFICVPATVTATTTAVRRGRRFFGVRLWPDTAEIVLGAAAPKPGAGRPAPLFTEAGNDLVKRVGPLEQPDDVWRELRAWCLDHIPQQGPVDHIVRRAIGEITSRGGDITTTDLAAMVEIGPRQLQRRFLAATGLTVKSYARVRRMRSALSHRLGQAAEPWSSTAAAAGFADQAHLTREFATMTGLAPRQVEKHLRRI